MGKRADPKWASVEAVAAHLSRSIDTASLPKTLANVPIPRLRYDKVALRFVRDLGTKLAPLVPDGKTLIVTIAAPIRMASKTAAAVEARVREKLADFDGEVEGNTIRMRLVKGSAKEKVCGFVYTPGVDAEILFELTEVALKRR